jgi:hypothetical protein
MCTPLYSVLREECTKGNLQLRKLPSKVKLLANIEQSTKCLVLSNLKGKRLRISQQAKPEGCLLCKSQIERISLGQSGLIKMNLEATKYGNVSHAHHVKSYGVHRGNLEVVRQASFQALSVGCAARTHPPIVLRFATYGQFNNRVGLIEET